MYLSGFGSETYLSSQREDENMRAVLCSLLLGFLLVLNTEGWWGRRRRSPCHRVNCQVQVCVLFSGYCHILSLFEQVNSWGSWGSCSKKCGMGTQWRYRSVSTSARCGGSSCPSTSVGTRFVKYFGLHRYCLG